MRNGPPRDYDELVHPETWPLSAGFHAATKLTERRGIELEERAAAFAQQAEERWPGSPKSYPSRPQLPLPRAPERWFGTPLERALRGRRSQRGAFREAPLELARLGALLEHAFGITRPGTELAPALRAFPSAGGLFPLEIYVATLQCQGVPRAVHHYDPTTHALAELAPCPATPRGFWFSDNEHPALAVFLTAVFARTQGKYDERGYRFALLEAGHAMQNALLVAHALKMGALPVGGFCEDAIGSWLGLDAQRESTVYAGLFGS